MTGEIRIGRISKPKTSGLPDFRRVRRIRDYAGPLIRIARPAFRILRDKTTHSAAAVRDGSFARTCAPGALAGAYSSCRSISSQEYTVVDIKTFTRGTRVLTEFSVGVEKRFTRSSAKRSTNEITTGVITRPTVATPVSASRNDN